MRNAFDAIPVGLKHAIDLTSVLTLVGSLVSVLPALASILTIVWTVIRIYETPTVQRFLERRRAGQ